MLHIRSHPYPVLFSLFLDAILNRFELLGETGLTSKVLPFAVEASWVTRKWDKLHRYLQICPQETTGDFDIGIGLAFDAFRNGNKAGFTKIVNDLRLSVSKSLTANSVTSLQSCHDNIFKLHALMEIESIANHENQDHERSKAQAVLSRRLDALGGYISDKQYLLSLRRAAMELKYVSIRHNAFRKRLRQSLVETSPIQI